MRVLSIDVGTKNLAYCVVDLAAPGDPRPANARNVCAAFGKTQVEFAHELLHFAHEDIRGDLAENIRSVLAADQFLQAHRTSIDVAVIEHQYRAPMTKVQFLLHARLIDLLPEHKIVHQGSTKRLKLVCAPAGLPPKQQQQADFLFCCGSSPRVQRVKKGKLGDISDSFMQAIAYFCDKNPRTKCTTDSTQWASTSASTTTRPTS